ncbi:hypothetical protein BVX97_06570 [bacterium E08(2017)]|nr:hypothetical protein BVX97_06570 [bacterium E08(2017)]
MKQPDKFDFWYAVNNTEIVQAPTQHLETFGNTMLNYYHLSELMDSVDQVRIREGRMQANKPQIITPEAYSQTLLDGFGEEAEKYIDWLKKNDQDVKILQYGYKLTQQSFSEHTVTDKLDAVVDRVRNDKKVVDDPLSAVVIGVDQPWDVCLIKLFWQIIQSSAGANIQELSHQGLFSQKNGIPMPIYKEVEAAFLAASRDSSLINSLAETLNRHNLFKHYEDRFFALVKASK